jgi:hypothetical protein
MSELVNVFTFRVLKSQLWNVQDDDMGVRISNALMHILHKISYIISYVFSKLPRWSFIYNNKKLGLHPLKTPFYHQFSSKLERQLPK